MRLSRLDESGKVRKIGISEYMYPEYEGLFPPDFGPGLEYHDMGDRLTALMAGAEDDPSDMILSVSLMDNEMDDYEYVYSHGYGRYPKDETGYRRAKTDFMKICTALSRGEDPERVAKRFNLVKIV